VLFQTVFREKALARRARQETVDARLQVTAPHEWLLVSGLAVALVVLLLFGLFGRAERSHSVDAVLVHPGDRVDVVAGVPGVVVELLAEVGDVVEAGQPIARVRTPDAERWGAVFRGLGESAAGDGSTELDADGLAVQVISTPHGGEVVNLGAVVGQRIAAGALAARVRTPSSGPVEALAFVTREEAGRLLPGMSAQVLLALPGTGAARALAARVEEVSPHVVPPSPWMVEFGIEPPPSAHLVRAMLQEPEPEAVVDGAVGTLRIVLGHRSFASLVFGSGDA